MPLPLPRLLLAFPLLAACAAPAAAPPATPAPPAPQIVMVGPAEGVRLRVAPQVVDAGGEVTLSLVNERRDEVGYNLCTSRLGRLENGHWQTVPQDGACTRELRIAAPGTTATYTKRLPAGLAPGRYAFSTRVAAPLGGPQPQQIVMSHSFEVR